MFVHNALHYSKECLQVSGWLIKSVNDVNDSGGEVSMTPIPLLHLLGENIQAASWTGQGVIRISCCLSYIAHTRGHCDY